MGLYHCYTFKRPWPMTYDLDLVGEAFELVYQWVKMKSFKVLLYKEADRTVSHSFIGIILFIYIKEPGVFRTDSHLWTNMLNKELSDQWFIWSSIIFACVTSGVALCLKPTSILSIWYGWNHLVKLFPLVQHTWF